MKPKLLGFINFIFAVFFAWMFVTSPKYGTQMAIWDSLFQLLLPSLLIAFFAGMNGYLGFQLLKNKKQKSVPAFYGILTFAPLFWFVGMFLGYFIASSIFLPIAVAAISVAIFYYFRDASLKIAKFLTITTVVVAVILLAGSFEEDYCWDKGSKADPTGTQMIPATAEDAAELKSYGIAEGQLVAIGFSKHMRCHQTFNLRSAIADQYWF